MLDDVIVGGEDPVGQPVIAHELPDVLHRVQFRRAWWQRKQRDVGRDGEPGRAVPAGLIEDQNGMGARLDGLADLLQMLGHGLGVAPWHDETSGLALLWADGPEDIGPFGALIVRGAGTRAASRPAAGDLVLLADARLVLPPKLYPDAGGEARLDPLQRGRETF